MNLALFFEGTGQGVVGRETNVTRLFRLCAADENQLLHAESGPGTHFGAYLAGKIHGADWKGIFDGARAWFDGKRAQAAEPPRVFLFGFSRGALIARHFAADLARQEIPVAYMGLWDTVDATTGLDVSETCPANVRVARHALARDEMRRFFEPIRLRADPRLPDQTVREMVFPGVHSDVGGYYADNHAVADVTLAWIASGATRCGLRLRAGIRLTQRFDPARVVLHASHTLVSNLFGALAPVRRTLTGIRRHPLCRVSGTT